MVTSTIKFEDDLWLRVCTFETVLFPKQVFCGQLDNQYPKDRLHIEEFLKYLHIWINIFGGRGEKF